MSTVARTWNGTISNMSLDAAHRALEGATSLLFMIAREMDEVGEEGAGERVIFWENSLRFIARSLDDNAGDILRCVQMVEDRAALTDTPG